MLPTPNSGHTTHAIGTSNIVDSYHQVQEMNPINNNSKSNYNYHTDTTAATTEQYRQDVDNCCISEPDEYSIMQNNHNHQQQLLHFPISASSTTTQQQTNYHQQQHNIPPPFSTDNNKNIKFAEVITSHTNAQNNRNNPFVYNNNNNSSYQYNEIDCESSSSSFLLLHRDDQKYHYTNFLAPENKKELLTTMLSEMSFWETPSTSTQQVQDSHHPNQQQQQQQQQPLSVRTPTTRTSQISASASVQRQQEEPYSGTYSNLISRFRNGNTSNNFRDSTASDSNVNKKVAKTSSPVKAAIPKTASGLSVKKLLSTTSSSHRSTGSPSAIITTGRPKSIGGGDASAASEEDLLNKELDALDPSKISWKHAVDPATGRVYYYDSITRKTQWEKPREIRLLEKKNKRDLRRADIAFFRIMEQNLINSLRRGEKIPCVSPDHYNKEGPPCEPTTSPPQTRNNSIDQLQHMQTTSGNDKVIMSISKSSQQSKAKSARVRTISGMDQHVLAQLGSTTYTIPKITTSSANPVQSSINNGSNNTSNTNPSSNTSARSSSSNKSTGTNNVRLSSNVHQNDVTSGPTGAGLPLIEGRPPLAQRRSSTTSTSSAVAQQQHLSTIAPQQSLASSPSIVDDTMDSLQLSPDADDFGAKTVDMELRGIDLLLDDGSIDDDTGENGNNESKSSIANDVKGPTVNITNHVRRHTGNTMHFDTTMDNPNIDATMQCVCGVYRAHIVQAAELQQAAPPSQQQQNYNPALDVFRDDYEQYCLSIAKGGSGAAFNRTHRPAVPSLIEIKAFYNEFYQRSQMEHDTIIMSLIYVERLMKDTNGALTPNTYNWRSVLFSCMILASKVWDDLSMWNIDFSNVSVAASSSSNLLSAFSLQRINQLELAVLSNLSFRTAIPASEYAKYYFLIRTMLMRSGILKGSVSGNGDSSNSNHSLGGIFRTTQQEAEAANRLENRSSLYQETLSSLSSSAAMGTNHQHPQLPNSSSRRVDNNSGTSTGNHRAAARSIDWSYFMSREGTNNNNAGEKSVVEATMAAPVATATGSNVDVAFPPVVINDITTTASMMNDITASTSARIGPVLHDTVCLKQIVSSG